MYASTVKLKNVLIGKELFGYFANCRYIGWTWYTNTAYGKTIEMKNSG